MGDVFDALSRSKGKPAPLDLLNQRPIQVESGAGLSFDEAELAARSKPPIAPLNPLPADPLVSPAPRPAESPSPPIRADEPETSAGRAAMVSQQYRQIRDGMRQRAQARGTKVHLFASSTGREGRSPTLINIAIALSEIPRERTLLLEADLHTPALHRFFQKPFTPGLAHLLRGELVTLEDATHPSGHAYLDVLPAGDCVFGDPDARSLLLSQTMADLMMELRSRYDHILIDAPALEDCGDACVLASMADEALLIVQAQKTSSDQVERSRRLLRSTDIFLAGTILSHR